MTTTNYIKFIILVSLFISPFSCNKNATCIFNYAYHVVVIIKIIVIILLSCVEIHRAIYSTIFLYN